MKDRPPAFQFYPRQFAGDDQVSIMDLDAIGAHILMMCSAAASPEGYRIPAGTQPDGSPTRAIGNLLRNPSAEDWQRIESQLLAGAWKVSADGLWWEQDGLRKTIEKQRSFSELQSARALGRSRKPAGMQPEASRNAAETMPSSSSSSSSSSNTLSPEILIDRIRKIGPWRDALSITAEHELVDQLAAGADGDELFKALCRIHAWTESGTFAPRLSEVIRRWREPQGFWERKDRNDGSTEQRNPQGISAAERRAERDKQNIRRAFGVDTTEAGRPDGVNP